MATGDPGEEEPYDEDNDYEWTSIAYDLLVDRKLTGHVLNARGVRTSTLSGPCPRCGHTLNDAQTLSAAAHLLPTRGVKGEKDQDRDYYPVDVTCGCGRSHPGAKDDVTGCGVSFRVLLRETKP